MRVYEFEWDPLKAQANLIPILVRPCPWQVFDLLKGLQGLINEKKVLSGLTNHDLERTLADLMETIRTLLNQSQIENEPVEMAEVAAELPPPTAPLAAYYELPDQEGVGRDERGFLTNAGVTELILDSPRNASRDPVIGLIPIFESKRQRTWLAVTHSKFFCVLDDEETRAARRGIQWSLPLAMAAPIRVRPRATKTTGLVDIGAKTGWLYSQRLHPNEKILETGISNMTEAGRRA